MSGKINISLKAKQGVILKRWNYQELKFQGVRQVAHFSIIIIILKIYYVNTNYIKDI